MIHRNTVSGTYSDGEVCVGEVDSLAALVRIKTDKTLTWKMSMMMSMMMKITCGVIIVYTRYMLI